MSYAEKSTGDLIALFQSSNSWVSYRAFEELKARNVEPYGQLPYLVEHEEFLTVRSNHPQ